MNLTFELGSAIDMPQRLVGDDLTPETEAIHAAREAVQAITEHVGRWSASRLV